MLSQACLWAMLLAVLWQMGEGQDGNPCQWNPPDKNGLATIPAGETSIPEKAYFGCTSLVSISIPDSVTTIGEEAFSTRSNLLKQVTIPASVTSIGYGAFMDCAGL